MDLGLDEFGSQWIRVSVVWVSVGLSLGGFGSQWVWVLVGLGGFGSRSGIELLGFLCGISISSTWHMTWVHVISGLRCACDLHTVGN